MLRLEPVDRFNFNALIDLSVDKEQEAFVVPNAYSLAQAGVQPECVPLGVYEGNRPVGFAMYSLNPDDRAYWIYRLMIDRRYQGKGYGREALRQLIALLRAKPDCESVYISFEPGNERAKGLYESMGFAPDGRVLYGEIVYRLV